MDRRIVSLVVAAVLVILVVIFAVTNRSGSPVSDEAGTPITGQNTPDAGVVETSSLPAGAIPGATPTKWPTPERIIVSKERGQELMSELNLYTREVSDGLLELAKTGKDIREFRPRLTKLNYELSQAGYRLSNSTDAVSTKAAEDRILEIRKAMEDLAAEAGVPK